MSRFATEVLTQDGNVEGLGRMNATWVDQAMKTDMKGILRLQTHLLMDRPAIDWPCRT